MFEFGFFLKFDKLPARGKGTPARHGGREETLQSPGECVGPAPCANPIALIQVLLQKLLLLFARPVTLP